MLGESGMAAALNGGGRRLGGAPASSMGIESAAELLRAAKSPGGKSMDFDFSEPAGGRAGKQQQKENRNRGPSRLRDAAPAWWPLSEPYVKAADSFDTRHSTHRTRAERVLRHLSADASTRSGWGEANHFHEVCVRLHEPLNSSTTTLHSSS